jgi:HEAT repeat protein
MAEKRGMKAFDLNDLVQRLKYAGADALAARDLASWQAFRELERLRDPTLLPRLAELCEANNNEVRSHAYFVVGCLGACTGHQGVIDLLLHRCAAEQSWSGLVAALGALEKQPQLRFEPILAELAWHDYFLVKSAALTILGQCPEPEAEDALLDVLRRSKERNDLVWASAALADRATAHSLPVARTFLTHPDGLLRANALRIMARSGNVSLLPTFLKVLAQDRSTYVKPAAVESICRVGGASMVPVVLDRLKTVLARKRACLPLGRTEVNYAVEFLDRFRAHDPNIEKLFRTILTKRADRLFDGEKRELRKNVPYFTSL